MPNQTYTWEAVVDTRQAARSINELPEQLRRAFGNVRIELINESTISGARNAMRGVTNDYTNAQSRMTDAARSQAQQRVSAAQGEADSTSRLAQLFGRVRIQKEQEITAAVESEIQKRKRLQQEEANPNFESKALSGLQGAIVGGVAGYFTVQGIRQIAQTGVELAQMNTTLGRSEKAFETLSGSAEKAEKILRAVQTASGNTVTEFQAIQIANQAQALGLAKTTEQFEKLTKAARAVTFVSPVIHDVQSAITELALASANLSFRRLDQLGLSVTEVKAKMAELKAANSGLDDSQAFLQASVDSLNQKFGGLLDSTEAQAGGVEKLTVAWSNFMQVVAQGPLGEGANRAAGYAGGLLDKLTALLSGDYSKLANTQELQKVIDQLNVERNIRQNAGINDPQYDHSAEIAGLQNLLDVQTAYDKAVQDGVVGLDQYASALSQITGQAIVQQNVTAEQAQQVDYLNKKLVDVVNALNANTQAGQYYAQAVALVGSETLQANEKTSDLIDHMVDLTVKYNAGIVSGSEYTAAINTMGGQLVGLAQNAANAAVEVANLTYQTQAFYAAQNSKLYFGSGGTKGTRPIGPLTPGQVGQLATDTSINPFTRQAQEQSFKTYQQQLEAEQKKAAAEAKKAATAGVKAFNQAQKEFESMIDSIVKVSQVTQQDIEDTKLGIYKNKPDEYLRRLRDEVNNGKDYKDVSIEDAAAGLNRIGIDTVGKSKEAILKLFESAFGNLSLFADEANLKFLDDTAVQEQIHLQELAKKGQENVYKHFGGVIESAVSAAMGGYSVGGGGGAAGSAAAEGVAPTISIDGAALAGGNLDITATITKLELAEGVVASPVKVSATITAYVEDPKATKPVPMVTGAISKYEQLASAPVPIVSVGATITDYGERTDAEKPTPTVSAGITVFLESATAEKPTPTVSAGITKFLESATAEKPVPTLSAGITKFLESSTAEKPTPTVEARMVFSSTRVDFAADEAELARGVLTALITPTLVPVIDVPTPDAIQKFRDGFVEALKQNPVAASVAEIGLPTDSAKKKAGADFLNLKPKIDINAQSFNFPDADAASVRGDISSKIAPRLVFSSERVDFAADSAQLVNKRLSDQIKVRINLGDPDQGFYILPADAERISKALSTAIAPNIDLGVPGRISLAADAALAIKNILGASITPHVTPIIDLPSAEALQAAQQSLHDALSQPVQGPPKLSEIGIPRNKPDNGSVEVARQYVTDISTALSTPDQALRMIGIGAQVRETINSGFTLSTDTTIGADYVVMMQRQIFSEANIPSLLAIGASTFAFIIAGFRNAMNDKSNTVGQEFVNGLAAQVTEAQTKAAKEEQ